MIIKNYQVKNIRKVYIYTPIYLRILLAAVMFFLRIFCSLMKFKRRKKKIEEGIIICHAKEKETKRKFKTYWKKYEMMEVLKMMEYNHLVVNERHDQQQSQKKKQKKYIYYVDGVE